MLLSSFISEVDPTLKNVTSISTVMDIMKKEKLIKMFSELHLLLRLYLTVPLSNAPMLQCDSRKKFLCFKES